MRARRVKVCLCTACAEYLRTLRDEKGEAAMIEATAGVLRGCATCRLELPAQLRNEPFVTVPKARKPAHD